MHGAPKFKMSQGWFVVCILELATTDLCIKFEISTSTHYKDMKGEKCKNSGGLRG